MMVEVSRADSSADPSGSIWIVLKWIQSHLPVAERSDSSMPAWSVDILYSGNMSPMSSSGVTLPVSVSSLTIWSCTQPSPRFSSVASSTRFWSASNA